MLILLLDKVNHVEVRLQTWQRYLFQLMDNHLAEHKFKKYRVSFALKALVLNITNDKLKLAM